MLRLCLVLSVVSAVVVGVTDMAGIEGRWIDGVAALCGASSVFYLAAIWGEIA